MKSKKPAPQTGEWLTALLKHNNKRGSDLAAALGLPKARIYELIKGERRWQIEDLRPAAKFLGLVDADMLSLMLNETTLDKILARSTLSVGTKPMALFDDAKPGDLVPVMTTRGDVVIVRVETVSKR
jgi:plasmid maintenance system antidote protein VapI